MRILWVSLILLIGCTQKITQTVSSSSVAHCDSSISSKSQSQSQTQTASPTEARDVYTRVGKVHLDIGTLSEAVRDLSFKQFLPDQFIQNHRGYRNHRVGENQLVAVIDHACTLNNGIDSRSKTRKLRPKLSETLMTEEDESFQDPRLKIRRTSRPFLAPTDISIEELADLVEADPCIITVGNDAPMRILAPPTDTHYAANLNQKTRYLDSINFAAAYEKFFAAGATPITADVTIAVIDSGVRITHEDLDGNLWVNSGEVAANSIDDDGNGKVDDINGWNFASSIASPAPQTWVGFGGSEGHGTHVAGIIAAEYNGIGVVGIIGNHSKIMGLNVFGTSATATTSNIDNAIAYAVNKGAKVINMSIGGETYAASTHTAISNAIAAGTVVVAAAGNGDSDNYGLVLSSSYGIYPASLAKDINGMLSVGSFDALTGSRSIFSNCSSTYVEVSAPGAYDSSDVSDGGIPSTWSTANNTYLKKLGSSAILGTSMASPVAAGAAALAMSLYKTNHGSFPSAANVESWLLSGSTTTSALSNYVKNGKTIDLNALYTFVNAQ